MIDAQIELTPGDRRDLNLSIEIINTADSILRSLEGLETLTEDEVRNIYQGACDALIEGRVMMHSLRQNFVKKYNIPYNFISINGKIYLND